MRLSYFTQSVHPPAKDYRRVLHEDSEVILLADELGYVEAFLGEHITDRNEKMLQSIDMMLAIRGGRAALQSDRRLLDNVHQAHVERGPS